QRTLAPPRKDHMALGFDAFGPFGEAGRSEAKRLSDAAIARGEAPAVALRPLVAPVRRVALPPGLGPRELVLAQILLGPPRAFARLEDEIVPTRP
ncbi:MAG TPA: hypothetical protein PKE00_11800, partial [Planctomycetota bacterium]|nr:hypothetical protein [Planctomycetota bacterium]